MIVNKEKSSRVRQTMCLVRYLMFDVINTTPSNGADIKANIWQELSIIEQEAQISTVLVWAFSVWMTNTVNSLHYLPIDCYRSIHFE